MPEILNRIIGQKINGVRVVPLMIKIVMIFIVFLLVTNFITNYLNLQFNRGEQIRLLNELLVKDLKDLYIFAGNQFDIVLFDQDIQGALKNMEDRAGFFLNRQLSLTIAIRADGSVLFQAENPNSENAPPDATTFSDQMQLKLMNSALENGIAEDTTYFTIHERSYYGVYKWHPRWEAFFIRAEELNEFHADSTLIFRQISLIIIIIVAASTLVGIFLIQYILRFVRVITDGIMKMQADQKIDLLDIKGSPNDDISYLGVAFNSLASTIDNLMNIFKKFVARDVAARAYKEREIRLEGVPKEMTILFSDIKGFTYMTEILGTDIIRLLNLHYDKAIHHIHANNGDVGSIIGDAILALFGAMDVDNNNNKSIQAVRVGYLIHDVAHKLRAEMNQKREEIIRKRGDLSRNEKQIYKAVMIEVGVGIDGGEVFYGQIGSYERMTNTVIGDTVNSSSRLEGLTRFYKVPVICSNYVKEEVELDSNDYEWLELDQVMVKGKTYGKRIYWPIPQKNIDAELRKDIRIFDEGRRYYYNGDWAEAKKILEGCNLPLANIFKERVAHDHVPENWNGVWTMTSK